MRISDWSSDVCSSDLMRVGLTREGVAEWGFRQEVPKEARLERARHMRLSGRFRADFNYSNLCYIALGLATERLSNRSLNELMLEAIFEPAGMEIGRASCRERGCQYG